jgi:cell division initiation protein
MATLDITPQELRDIEIQQEWRGYHRDDVDELLERAAATIEHLEAENDQLRARLAQGPPAAAPQAAPRPAAPQPQPAPRPAPEPAPIRTADTDVIQRTLVLAQKAADDAVAEAKARAAQIVTESEAHAQQLVADAESNARRIADAEKSRLESDIVRLTQARDTLTADVDALEQFERDYRERLRVAINAELDLLEADAIGATRPALHPVDVVIDAEVEAEPSWSASQMGEVAPEPAPAPMAPNPTVHIEAVSASDAVDEWDATPAGGWADQPAGADDVTSVDAGGDEFDEPADSLDDDAFFASLRQAVRDDAPLGPSDEEPAFLDEDNTEETRHLFRRKR